MKIPTVEVKALAGIRFDPRTGELATKTNTMHVLAAGPESDWITIGELPSKPADAPAGDPKQNA